MLVVLGIVLFFSVIAVLLVVSHVASAPTCALCQKGMYRWQKTQMQYMGPVNMGGGGRGGIRASALMQLDMVRRVHAHH
jgi:hypothetical protein